MPVLESVLKGLGIALAIVAVLVVVVSWMCRKDKIRTAAKDALVHAGTPESDLPVSAPPVDVEAPAADATPNEPVRCGLCQVMGSHEAWCPDCPRWNTDASAAVEPEDDQESTRPMSRAARRKLAEPLPDDAPLIEALRVGTNAYDAVDAPRVPSVAVVLASPPEEESPLFAGLVAKFGEPVERPGWDLNTSTWLALNPRYLDEQPALESADRAR